MRVFAWIWSLSIGGHKIASPTRGAAALTAADLSMAMGTGTDTAINSADITCYEPRCNPHCAK